MAKQKKNGRMDEEIVGLKEILYRAEHTANCVECYREIPKSEWKEYNHMCKHCYDTDGEIWTG